MHFTKFVPLLLAPLALASPFLEERAASPAAGAKAVVSAVKNIQAGIKALNDSVNKLKPNDPFALQTALEIQDNTSALEDDLNAAIQAAKKCPKLNNNLSLKVATATLNLQPKVKSLLNNIVVHKPAFATAVLLVGDLSQTVEKSLVTQRGLTKTLGNGIKAKLSKTYAQLAPTIIKQIDNYFKKAIKAYKECTGLICLPPIPSSS